MRAIAVGAILAFAVSGWAQSLGDLVRADREQAKPHARKVITNENLNEVATAHVPSEAAAVATEEPPDGLSPDLHRMKVILRNICTDPRTESGSNLSDDDKQTMNAGVKPLRARVVEFEHSGKQYQDALAAVDREFETKIVKTVNAGQPFTDANLQRVKSLWQEHDARRAALAQQREREIEGFRGFQQDLESISKECPAAAETVPD